MILKVLYQCFCFHLNCVGSDLLCNACDSMENSVLCLLCFHSLPFFNHSVDTHSIFNSCVGVYIFSFTNRLRRLQTDDPVDLHALDLAICLSLSFFLYIYSYLCTHAVLFIASLRNSGKDEWNANISQDDDGDDVDADGGDSMYCNIRNICVRFFGDW